MGSVLEAQLSLGLSCYALIACLCMLTPSCMWQASRPHFLAQGELKLQLQYKPFEDDEVDAGYREAEAYRGMLQGQDISDVKSAAGDGP